MCSKYSIAETAGANLQLHEASIAQLATKIQLVHTFKIYGLEFNFCVNMEVGASACMKEAEFQMQRQQWPI